ncbi:hypothetical protein SAY86_029961 [Trapa natans]|uniref:Uncharacterized protein n=1 Tax=Trapa natans TaxID=22666 RepID=A0AAN7MJR8_TRANT|nr:hypothetical protein SAY86_029961 [Trapa natans]
MSAPPGPKRTPTGGSTLAPGTPLMLKVVNFSHGVTILLLNSVPAVRVCADIYARKEGDKIRFSFGCRIKKGFGACSFSQEVDEERSVFALSQEMVTEVVNQGGIASGDPTSEDLAMEDMALLDHISQIDIETPGAIPRDPGIQNWQDEFLKLLLAVEDGPTQGDFPSFNAVKNKFITILDHINPFNLELLRSEAEKCFKILCRLHTVDSGKFIYRVMHYIECASSLANMESSCVPYPSTPLQELKDQCRVKQRGHEDISQLYSQKINAYNTSQGRLKVLLQDAARFRDMLSQTEREIANCEVESLELEMCLKDIKQKVEWSKKSLEAMTREVWEAEDRERKRSAAKDALEKARSQLRH